jgi:hypothetical protein
MNTEPEIPTKGREGIGGWIWALAFLWMPALCAALYFIQKVGSPIDRLFMYLAILAAPIVCGVAAVRISRRVFPMKKLWVCLNALVPLGSVIAVIWALLLASSLANAWEK